VPEPAQRAVLDKPRRLGDDLMFRSKRGRQFRQESLHRVWAPVRNAFTANLPAAHHLRERAVSPRCPYNLLVRSGVVNGHADRPAGQ
jgi:hypothetical protein